MSLLTFVAVASASGGVLAVLARWRRLRTPGALLGFGAALIAGLGLTPGEETFIGGSVLVTTEYGRLMLLFWVAAGMAITGLTGVTGWQPGLASGLLVTLAALAVALASPAPVAALPFLMIGSIVGSVMIAAGRTGSAAWNSSRELGWAVGSGLVATAGVSLVANPIEGLLRAPSLVGLVYLAVIGAAVAGFGTIPFHVRPSRLADGGSLILLGLLVWLSPAAFAIVGLAWLDATITPTGLALTEERTLVALLGTLTVVGAGVAALATRRLERGVAFAAVQNGGFIALGLAAADPIIWEPVRAAVLILSLGTVTLAMWAVALTWTCGTSHLEELTGWARRAPLLALALVAIGLAQIGLPTMAIFEARAGLIETALPEPFDLLGWLGCLLAVGYVTNLLRIGLLAGAAPRERDGPRRGVLLAGAIVATVSIGAIAAGAGGFGIPAAAQGPAPAQPRATPPLEPPASAPPSPTPAPSG